MRLFLFGFKELQNGNYGLAKRPRTWQSLHVKTWQIFALAAAVALGVGYVILHLHEWGLAGSHPTASEGSHNQAGKGPHPAAIEWKKLDRAGDGFKVEMPQDIKQIEIPAYTETGGTQPLKMIFSNPDAETTYSIAWQDDPPVARANRRAADQTLEMARDGAIARTQTTLVNEIRNNTQGFPGRTFEARNSGGGVMNAELIYTGPRLYMLMAAFPSISARRDRDVERFFSSFTITSAPGASAPANNSR
ncbi:MAG: hypothetical protein ABSF53_14305 [Terracidiphilus sp.]